MSDMAYSMEYRGLKALEELIEAAKVVCGPDGHVNADSRYARLAVAAQNAERLFGLDDNPRFFVKKALERPEWAAPMPQPDVYQDGNGVIRNEP